MLYLLDVGGLLRVSKFVGYWWISRGLVGLQGCW